MLDCAIGEVDPIKGNGGIPSRTIVECFGRNQSLKSSLGDHLIKSVLADDEDNHVFAIYSEEPDFDRLINLGINEEDLENRLHPFGCDMDEESKFKTAERYLEVAKKAVQDERTKLVIIDSIKALTPEKQLFDEKGNIKSLEESDPMAARAKAIGKFVREFSLLNKRAILLMVNQVSDKLANNYIVAEDSRILTPGGREKEFAAHLRIENTTRPITAEELGFGEHPILGRKVSMGWEVTYRLMKNKFVNTSANRTVKSRFMFDPPGFDKAFDVLACAEYLDLIQKGGGGHYTVNGEKLRGQNNVLSYLRNNKVFTDKLELEILSKRKELFGFKGGEEEDLLA